MSEEDLDPQQKALNHIAVRMDTLTETLQRSETAAAEHTDKIVEVLSAGLGGLIQAVNDGFRLIAQVIAERER